MLEQPLFLMIIPFGVFIIWKYVRQKGGLGFSSVALLHGIHSGRSLLTLERLALTVFVIATSFILARPIIYSSDSIQMAKEVRDITIVLDISGSMMDRVKFPAAKEVITKFVEGRPLDRVALFVFDNHAYIEWPLSLDHETPIARLNLMKEGGGTEIASGIIAGLKHQKKYGRGDGAIILISDGVSEVKPEERQAIEESLGNTKLYFILIGEEEDLTREFIQYVKKLGGTVYEGQAEDLTKIFKEIDRLEKTSVYFVDKTRVTYRFGILPLVAFFSLLIAGLLDILREV